MAAASDGTKVEFKAGVMAATSELRDQLQTALGTAYTLERELGGGGMSRVYAATETALGRKVVVKVLTPELAQGVNVERFKREVQLAAQLQQAHIVPLLAAGEANGLPYYTMPLVDGHSLRTRLVTGGPLPITEAIGVLRDVAKALAYAHDRGVVHRDIKPDNVLLSGGSAVVTDFGVAKALSASKAAPAHGTLTEVGMSLGTPAYMAPEQVAADPGTNHRADIYAFGVMAYELLAGRSPFHGRTPQKLLAAQMGERPQPIGEIRPDVPPLLAQLLTKCLEKDADDRPQSASDIVRVLETVTSGGAHPAMPAILLGGRRRLGRSLALYAGAFVAVAVVARAAIIAIGLPDWVFPGAVIVMALGLPVILFTAFVQHGAHEALTRNALTPGGSPTQQSTMTKLALKASPWVSWRRTGLGGVLALVAFVLLVAGYMVMRALGIGPAGSLFAKGVLKEREPLLVADTRVHGTDTTLGPVITEALRTSLEESRAISILPTSAARATLARMRRDPSSRLDVELAREVAQREGVKAVLAGDVSPLGSGYVVSARLVSADSGDELVSLRETADSPKELLGAVDQLGRRLRDKMGESLKSVRASPTLEQVSTSSLAALQLYTEAVTAHEGGEFARAVPLLRQAITLDTGFALAYRKLWRALTNEGGQEAQALAALQKAYDHRDRLTEAERLVVLASYYGSDLASDTTKEREAWEGLLRFRPTDDVALSNIATLAATQGRFVEAEQYAARAVRADSTLLLNWRMLIFIQLAAGDTAPAARSIAALGRNIPGSPWTVTLRAFLDEEEGRFDSAEALLAQARATSDADPSERESALTLAANLARARGRLRASLQYTGQARSSEHQRGVRNALLRASLDSAFVAVWLLGDRARALRGADAALRVHPMDSIPVLDRPYNELVRLYASAAQPARAQSLLAQVDRAHPALQAWLGNGARHTLAGHIAMAEHRYSDAVREYRGATQGGWCAVCALPDLGRAYDLAGQSDSTVAVFERFVQTLAAPRDTADGLYLAGVHKRLGELYDARGDQGRAAAHYAAFVQLWQHADAELQPQVDAVRRRLRTLRGAEGSHQ